MITKVNVNLDKELRQKHGTRNTSVRAGDRVKILKGKFKGTTGKIVEVDRNTGRVKIEGVENTKVNGSKVLVPIHFSNLQIRELDLKDKKRKAKLAAITAKPATPVKGEK